MRSYVDVKQSTPSIVASAWEGRANDAKDQQAVSPGQLRSRNCGPGDLSYFFDALEFYGFVSATSMIVRARESVIPYERWVTILLEV